MSDVCPRCGNQLPEGGWGEVYPCTHCNTPTEQASELRGIYRRLTGELYSARADRDERDNMRIRAEHKLAVALESHEQWERRAIQAEAEVERLRAGLQELVDSLRGEGKTVKQLKAVANAEPLLAEKE